MLEPVHRNLYPFRPSSTQVTRVARGRSTTLSSTSRRTDCSPDTALRGESGPFNDREQLAQTPVATMTTITCAALAATVLTTRPFRVWAFSVGIPACLGPHALSGNGDVTTLGVRSATDVGLGPHPLDHVRVVQLECRSLRTDPGQFGEVVPRRRAAGGPLQRVAVAPRIVDHDGLAIAPALEDVPHERDRRDAEDERTNRRDDVQRGEAWPLGPRRWGNGRRTTTVEMVGASVVMLSSNQLAGRPSPDSNRRTPALHHGSAERCRAPWRAAVGEVASSDLLSSSVNQGSRRVR